MTLVTSPGFTSWNTKMKHYRFTLMEEGCPNCLPDGNRPGRLFRILCQMGSQWQRNWICQQDILEPTPNWWNTSWNLSSIHSRVKWLSRTNESNTIHSCKHDAWGVQASQILLGWYNGHWCLCYHTESSLWNQWEDSIPSFLQLTGWFWNDQTHSRAGAKLEQGRDLHQWHSMANWEVEGETLCGKSEDWKISKWTRLGKTSWVRLGFIYCLGVYTCVH